MITKKEFMKDYRKMTSEEQKSYIERVEKWNEDTFPHLMAEVTSWLNVPVKEFYEGQMLCSAILRARPFLIASRSYKDVKAVLDKMNAILVEVRKASGLSKLSTRPAGDTRKWLAATEVKSAPDENGEVVITTYEEPEVDGRRPQHVAQYIHLLPKNLQMEASSLKQMHMELSMYRGEAEMLSRNANATREQVAEKARKAVELEQRIRTLYATIDAAYKSATNQKLSEEEKALLSEEEQPAIFKRAGEYTKSEIDAMSAGKMKDDLTAARIEADKRYLRRDVKVTDEYRKQLEIRANELVEWGVEIGDKGRQKLTEAGVVVVGVNDGDWFEESVVSEEAARVEEVSEAEVPTEDVQEESLDGSEVLSDGEVSGTLFTEDEMK